MEARDKDDVVLGKATASFGVTVSADQIKQAKVGKKPPEACKHGFQEFVRVPGGVAAMGLRDLVRAVAQRDRKLTQISDST